MKGTVNAEASVQQTYIKKTLMEYTGASKRKSSWANYWHGLCSTDCGQDKSC